MAFLGQEEQVREYQDRFKYLYIGLFVMLGLLLFRMMDLQILRGDRMRQFSEDNRIKRVKISAPRGMIFDRNRKLLIDNRPAFDLEVIPQYLRESKQEENVIQRLSVLLGEPVADLKEILRKSKNQPAFLAVKLKKDLTRDEVALIESWRVDLPGAQVAEEIKRTNIFADVASHLLGYIGEVTTSELPRLNKSSISYKIGDSVGKFGLEQKLESVLRGIDGEQLVEVDALGRTKLDKGKGRVLEGLPEKAPLPGKNLILTLDQDLQLAAVKAFEDKIGSLVAIDPRNGEILAMISRPSFDPTEFSRGISSKLWAELLNNENRPLKDKTIQDHYPPGSTFKIVTAVAGLEEGVIDETFKVRCSGSMRLGNRIYHCHEKKGHGEVNVVSAISKSCDVFFYRLAQKLESVDQISNWAYHFGLGKKTGINLAREVAGNIPTEAWKKKRFGEEWGPGETLLVAIGQSYPLVTTLQLANMFASIGNGGTLYKPYLVKEVESFEGQVVQEFKPEVVDKSSLSKKTHELVMQGLWGVVNSPIGTARSIALPGMNFVGKTGTVQVRSFSADKIYQKCATLKFRDRHHGIFAGFAPAKDPVIAVAVIAEHACSGSRGAGPIASAVVKTYLQKYFPDLYGDAAVLARTKVPLKGPQKIEESDIEDDEVDLVPNIDITLRDRTTPNEPEDSDDGATE